MGSVFDHRLDNAPEAERDRVLNPETRRALGIIGRRRQNAKEQAETAALDGTEDESHA